MYNHEPNISLSKINCLTSTLPVAVSDGFFFFVPPLLDLPLSTLNEGLMRRSDTETHVVCK